MILELKDKNIILGVSGSISAYKTPELVRRLRDYGAIVRVIMTITAKSFITPLTLEIVSGHKVADNLLDSTAKSTIINHIELAKWADLIILAPATTNLIARLSIGMTNDLLTTVCLASEAKIAIVPAMNQQMYRANVTQQNIEILKKRHILVWGPIEGNQACGDIGCGRMLDPLTIVELAVNTFQYDQDMLNLRLMITAGPTQEEIDQVRFISNHSSGKMGFAIAKAATRRGADVTLIAGPVNLSTPIGVKRINVISALEMYNTVHNIIDKQEIFIGCAAVSDYRPKRFRKEKIKKKSDEIILTLIRNPDILESVGKLIKDRPYVVGFAADMKNIKEYAYNKRIQKKIDMICSNDISLSDHGFNSESNALSLFLKDKEIHLPHSHKFELSHRLLNEILKCYEKKDKH
ncbi:MAG: bifunctional phosphopantothenoylcysteine decarboxylase/phosphopantothenate--cysteine ligase CoaBC [Arsenophonus sp. ET-DL9-MAG3]